MTGPWLHDSPLRARRALCTTQVSLRSSCVTVNESGSTMTSLQPAN